MKQVVLFDHALPTQHAVPNAGGGTPEAHVEFARGPPSVGGHVNDVEEDDRLAKQH